MIFFSPVFQQEPPSVNSVCILLFPALKEMWFTEEHGKSKWAWIWVFICAFISAFDTWIMGVLTQHLQIPQLFWIGFFSKQCRHSGRDECHPRWCRKTQNFKCKLVQLNNYFCMGVEKKMGWKWKHQNSPELHIWKLDYFLYCKEKQYFNNK